MDLLYPNEDVRAVLIRGYHLCADESVKRHAEKIRWYFRPQDQIIEEVKRQLLEVRKNTDLVVGVHIRRGDYKTWKNGQFYFEDAYFVELMKNCVDVFAGKRVRFVIF